jgi:hypothetical protein
VARLGAYVKGQFGFGLAMQVKCTMHLVTKRRRGPTFHCFFQVPVKQLFTSQFFYYFLGYLDPELMRLADPVFLIPSTFPQIRRPRNQGGYVQFTFMGSMSPTSHDRWQPFQVNTLELGRKMLEIMAEVGRQRIPLGQAAAILSMPDSLPVMAANGRYRSPS